MPEDERQRRRREQTRQRVARHRARKVETDAQTASFLAGKLLDRYPDAARVLAREVPAEHAEAIIEALQRRLAQDGPS